MERIEEAFKEATRTFKVSNQLTIDWLGEARRKIGDVGSKIEANPKKSMVFRSKSPAM